jgi:outer membrane protein OmpA-like peptidoglycan-associated protein
MPACGVMHGMSRLLLIALAVVATTARAAEDPGRFVLERWRPAVDRNGILDVESGATLPSLELDAALWVGYANEPLALYRRTDTGLVRAGALVGPRAGAHVVVALGLLDWLELGVDVPVVLYQARGALPAELPLSPLAVGGLSDVRLSPKFQLLHEADSVVDLAIVPTVTLPTSLPHSDYLGEKFFTVAPEVAVSKTLFGTRFAGGVGYRGRSVSKVGGVVVGHEAFYRLGLALPLDEVGVDVPVELEASLHGAVTVYPEPGANLPLEVLAGARTSFGPFQWFLAGGAGLVGGPGVPDFRVLTGLRWSVDLVDGDRDGIDDGDDRCADVAEDHDGYADDDGCPEADADFDGLADDDDRCPVEPEDRDEFEDADGCPDVDNDGDEVADVFDKCPRQPGEAAFGGCRPPDRDNDRVADFKDECPDVAAPHQPNGCPLVTAVPVEVKGAHIEIGERFLFAFDSAALLPASTKLVESVAAVLLDHPEVLKVRIEGHTDDTGFHNHNMLLSMRRALSVRQALIKKGVAPERLDAEGFGAANPLVEGTSNEARAQNRRVELVVIDP